MDTRSRDGCLSKCAKVWMPPNLPPSGTGLSSKIVLIADEDQTIRLLVSATLVSDQYSVLEAADGEEAWRLIRQYHPAVAILDWEMPGYEGLELTAGNQRRPTAPRHDCDHAHRPN